MTVVKRLGKRIRDEVHMIYPAMDNNQFHHHRREGRGLDSMEQRAGVDSLAR